MSSTFGKIFTLTTYGESHGAGLGGVVDGCPAGLPLSEADIQAQLDRRRPGGAAGLAGTARKEADQVRLLSGVYQGLTTGTPIAFHVENTNQRSSDYDELAKVWRPGHADVAYETKYALRDPRGGGRSSARETLSRVAGGAIAQAFLKSLGVEVFAYAQALGGISAPLTGDDGIPEPQGPARRAALAACAERPYCAASSGVIPTWEAMLHDARAEGDTVGGLVRIEALGVPAGLGEPVFDKLDAVLAHALMSVGAVKGVAVGSGFEAAHLRGSENNDPMRPAPGEKPRAAHLPPFAFEANHAGGILGGISTGQDVLLTASVKPIASLARVQQTVDVQGEAREIRVGGRHDICAIPRIVPVLQAMTALVLADMALLQRRMGRV